MLPSLEVGTEGASQFFPVALVTLLRAYLYGRLIKVRDLGGIGLCRGLLVAPVQLLGGLLPWGESCGSRYGELRGQQCCPRLFNQVFSFLIRTLRRTSIRSYAPEAELLP